MRRTAFSSVFQCERLSGLIGGRSYISAIRSSQAPAQMLRNQPSFEELLRQGRDAEAVQRLTDHELSRLVEARKWSQRLTREPDPIRRPNRHQWARLALRTALPYFAFGLCDNFIMISVGDLIDEHFGVVLGFSTLIAAGLGQAVSDGTGVTFQCAIERWTTRFNFANPNVDPRYLELPEAHRWLQLFRTVGIVCGCLIALIPVILMDGGNKPRLHDLLLDTLSDAERKALSAKARYATFEDSSFVVRRGDRVEFLDTIVSGEIVIYGRDPEGEKVELCRQGPGSGIGYLELVFGHNSVADVQCNGKVRTLRIPRQAFTETVLDLTKFARSVEHFIEHDADYTPYRVTRPNAQMAKTLHQGHVDGIPSLSSS